MKSRKILIHGSINTTNFGDVLFAEFFYKYIKDNQLGEPHFLSTPHLGVSDYVRQYLSYNEIFSLKDIRNSSLVVFMSGGYFGDAKKSLRGSLTRFAKYISIYLLAKRYSVPLVVCGVGGGPLYHWFNRHSFTSVLEYAKRITVRDDQTKEYFETKKLESKILTTTDSALIITPETYTSLDPIITEELNNSVKVSKKLYIHVPHNLHIIEGYKKELIPAVNLFVESNPEYGIVFITDELHGIPKDMVDMVQTCNKYIYKYTTPDQLCAFLSYADVVITVKLHIGIVSSALGKSVISFPLHVHKTWRFYAQIKESGRTVPFANMNKDVVFNQLEKYHNVPISISSELREKAAMNFEVIKDFLNS